MRRPHVHAARSRSPKGRCVHLYMRVETRRPALRGTGRLTGARTSSLPTTYDIAVSPQTVLLQVLNAQHTAGAQENAQREVGNYRYPVHVGLATARPRSGGAMHALHGAWTCAQPVNCTARAPISAGFREFRSGHPCVGGEGWTRSVPLDA